MKSPEQYRIEGLASYGPFGAYLIPPNARRQLALRIIASGAKGWESMGFALPAWEHVSVSTAVRCPTWEEMCLVKDLFWDADECVLQFHPPRSEYVNCHPFTLHLWRPDGIEIPRPPSHLVGPRFAIANP